MTIAIALCVFLLCAEAQNGAPPALACNRNAIARSRRPRYDELIKRLRAAIRDRSAVRDGYAFKLDSSTISLPEIAEWISMERSCCPFLVLQLAASGYQTDWTLAITGPSGVKALLDMEFPPH